MSLVSNDRLIAVKRPQIMKVLDDPGKIPVIGGIPIGIIRLTTSVCGSIFCGLGAIFSCRSEKWYGRFTFQAKYFSEEGIRAISEIFCFSFLMDISRTRGEFWRDELNDEGGAFGDYVYESQNGFMVFSKSNHDNKLIRWRPRLAFENLGSIFAPVFRNQSTRLAMDFLHNTEDEVGVNGYIESHIV